MRWRIGWMDGAVSDLEGISGHIERDRNVAAANRVTQAIYDAVRSLAADAVSRPVPDVWRARVS